MTDPITIAYLAIGAARLLDMRERAGASNDDALEANGGELNLIGRVIAHADTLDAACNAVGDRYAGVFAYDVAETFGAAAAAAYLDGRGEIFDRNAAALAESYVENDCTPAH